MIPDTQVKPGAAMDHLSWAGQYIVDQFGGQDDVKIVHLGDHWDMPSLSSYDKGTKAMEGRRYVHDIEAGNEAMDLFNAPFIESGWSPESHFLMGNHEERIDRAVNANPQLEGALGYDQLNLDGWEVHDFLDVLWLDGIAYSHYFYNPMSGRPYSAMMETRLKNIGHSFTMGHQQTLIFGIRYTLSGPHYGLVAGAFYQHDEGYKGPQGNDHWRGIVVKHEVRDGRYDPMLVSLDYLRRRYG